MTDINDAITQATVQVVAESLAEEEKAMPVSPRNGNPVPEGGKEHRFKTGEERAREAGKRGARKRKIKRDCQSIAQMVLAAGAPLDEAAKEKIADLLGLTVEEVTINVVGTFAQAKKAAAGDLSALCYLRDTAGEKPLERVAVASTDSAKKLKEVEKFLYSEKED